IPLVGVVEKNNDLLLPSPCQVVDCTPQMTFLVLELLLQELNFLLLKCLGIRLHQVAVNPLAKAAQFARINASDDVALLNVEGVIVPKLPGQVVTDELPDVRGKSRRRAKINVQSEAVFKQRGSFNLDKMPDKGGFPNAHVPDQENRPSTQTLGQ